MTCSASTIPAGSAPARSRPDARGVANMLRQRWTAYWVGRARRTTVLMLQALDDHTLRDIGLGRSEIESAVYGQDGERRLHYRTDWE